MGLKALRVVKFFMRIGRLDRFEVAELGLKPCVENGLFKPHRLSELEEFCTAHPDYHIVSHVDSFWYVNQPVLHSYHYFLANGDSNPGLVGYEPRDPVKAFERSR